MSVLSVFVKSSCATVVLCMLTMCAQPGRTYTVNGSTSQDIQTMIDKAFQNGGGKVVVPAGVYDMGSIQLKSNVELHLEKDALLMGADSSEAYDSFPEDVCAIQPENSSKVLIYAYNSQNIAITGEGIIDGNGPRFFDTTGVTGLYPKPPVERPRMVQFVNCDGIRLEGPTFKDSPCWTMFIRFCSNIDVNNIAIIADQRMINNDGIDFDGCSHVRVSNSYFKTCDDCIILRAMRESFDQHVVCEDVIVSDCELNSRCQTVRLGCPSDDVIRNALFKNIKASGRNGIFADYPTRYLNSDDEGHVDISNIVFDNYSGTFDGSALQIVSQPGVKIRRAEGFIFRNFDVISAYPLNFIGNAGHEIGSVLLENFKAKVLKDGAPYVVRGCNGLEFKDVVINETIYPDGVVDSEPGDDSPLIRGASVSWEQRKKVK